MARHFLRLKAALLASAFQRGWQHALGLVAGVLFGLPLALGLAVGLAAAAGTDVGPALYVLVVAALAVGWTLVPVLFFGLDETLDPARLWLLPLSRRQLLGGLTVSACLGIMPVATLLLLAAGVAYARSPAGVMITAAAVAVQFLVCLWAGRALATALSATLRSRKGRDIAAAAAVLVGLGFAGIGQIPNLVINVLGGDPEMSERVVTGLDRTAGIVALTPPGWAGGAVIAAADGRLLTAVGLLAAATGLAVALAWAWQAALARALATPDSASSSRSGTDAPLIPRAIALLGGGHLAASVAKELRYTLRVPQLRVGLVLLAVFAAALVVATALVDPLRRPEIVYAPTLLAVLQAFQAINGFGHDRGAVWLLVVSGSHHRWDLAGKGIASSLVVLVITLPVMGVLAVLTGAWSHLLPAVGLAVALLAAAHGVGAVASVLAPYPMPEGASNLWGTSSGMGCATALMQFAAFSVQALLLAPAAGAFAAAWFLAPALLPLAVLLAMLYGAGIWWAGVELAATRLAARGPEIVDILSADSKT